MSGHQKFRITVTVENLGASGDRHVGVSIYDDANQGEQRTELKPGDRITHELVGESAESFMSSPRRVTVGAG